MAKNNLTILFWLFKSKPNRNGEIPLYLRVSYGNKRKNIATGFNLDPSRWDVQKGAVRGSKGDAQHINHYIQQAKGKLMDIFNKMLLEGDVHLEGVIDRFLGKDAQGMTLLELVASHNADFKARVGIDYAPSTFQKYDYLRQKLEAFIPLKYQKKDIRLKDLSLRFITDFDFYLKDHDRNEHNTAAKYLKNLKKVANFGVQQGYLQDSPFDGYKSSYKDVDRVYLTWEELEAIRTKQFRLERLSVVRDLFLFQCYTGLAYSDMAKLTLGHISPGIDGNKWIITRRKKTYVRAAIPLLPPALSLVEKYHGGQTNSSTPLFPFYSIQKFNSYLHEIADLCGINKNLTSHVGRRTFATTIALGHGIGLETISKILGHATTKITAQYAVVTDIKLAEDMKLLGTKLKKRK